MRNPLDRPQTLTEAGSPGSSRVHSMKSLVADNPSTLTFTTTHRESPCGRQPLDIHGPAPRKALRQTVPRAFANPRSNAGRIAQRNTPMQKPADPKGRLGQTRASPTASTGCAVFAKEGFLCDNKRHQLRGLNRPVGAAGAQVPYKHKVTGSNPVPATIKTAGQTFFV